MKKEKIIFAFFVIPIFLFSASLKHLRFDRSKNPNPAFSQQQIKYLNEGQPLHPKAIHNVQDQVSAKFQPALSEKSREATGSAYRSRKLKRKLQAGSKDFRSERDRKQNPSVFRQKIKYLNEGRPFRYKGPHYVPDQVLVKFKPTLSEQMIKATIKAYRSRELKRIPRIDIYKLQIPENISLEEMLFMLRRNPDVEYAEPNYIAYITVTPNDTLFDYQYALYNEAQEIGPPGSPKGKEGRDIKATTAWKETKGDEEIIIAVVDTGVDLEHPDIKNKIHSSGYDFVNDDSDATDDFAHGTHVAGIAAAETHNSEGIAGVAWNCKILPVKVMDDLGEGTYGDMIEGIIWAADNGADVINLSLGGDLPSQSLEAALKYAYDKDIVIVASTGNDGGAVLYPAAYDDYCLAVAATDYNDLRADWSNFGPEVDVAAPGVRIVSLVPTWYWGPGSLPYAYGDGTSMAAPHVAGMAALIKSIKPWLTAAEIMNVIRYSADDVNSANNFGKDGFIGYGRINMEKGLVPIKVEPLK